MGTASPAIQVCLWHPDGTNWETNIQADSKATESYAETERVTSIHKDLFYLESNGRRINESDTLQQNNLHKNPHVRIIMKLKVGASSFTVKGKRKRERG